MCFLLYLLFICLSIADFGVCQMLGPADFIYKSAEQCPDAPQGIRAELTGRKVNRTAFGLTLEVDSPYDFDENLGLELMGSTKMDGGYKPGYIVYNNTNACKAMEMLIGDIFEDFKRQSNVDGCPFSKGQYLVTDFVFNNDNFNVPKLYGDYRMEVKLVHDGAPQSCLLAYYELVPKNKFKG